MISEWRLLCVLIVTMAGIAACDNQKIESLQGQIARRDNTIRSLEARTAEISQQCRRLETRVNELKAKYENLNVQNENLSRWSKELAKRFGPSLWYFGRDEKPLPVKSYDDATPNRILNELNRMFAASNLPQVQLTKIDNKVAYIQIRDEWTLTQNMGTTGATAYIQSVTYTLTSLPGIDYVEFAFHAGDHALPGRYSR